MIHRPPRVAAGFAVCLLAATAAAEAGAPAGPLEFEMVADLNTVRSGGTENWLAAGYWATFAGEYYGPLDDGVHGTELWATDGTPEGTRLVADLCPGVCSSFPLYLTPSGGRLYFAANDGLSGEELWVTDGTAAGSSPLELVPGPVSSFPTNLHAFAGRLFFSAAVPGLGREPWASDGTPEGTAILVDLAPGQEDSSPTFLGEAGGRLLFAATDSLHGREVWTTDGSEAGTVVLADIVPGPESGGTLYESWPANRKWARSGDRVFFFTRSDEQLWVSDGTAAGTGPLLVGSPGWPQFSTIESLGGGRVVFAHDDSTHGEEIWVSDGTVAGTTLLLDLVPGSGDGYPWMTKAWDGKAFFFANDGVHGFEPWVTDGTAAGTALLADAQTGAAGQPWLASIFLPVPFGNQLLFFAEDEGHGIEPWTTDGTPGGATRLADLVPGADGSSALILAFDVPADFGSRAFFRAFDPEHGIELWTTDGTEPGTQRLEVNRQASSFLVDDYLGGLWRPRPFGVLGDLLLFKAGEEFDLEPWVSDGTAAGTRRLGDLAPGIWSSSPYGFVSLDRRNALFFARLPDSESHSLWRTDGTPEGTQFLSEGFDFPSGCAEPFEGELVAATSDNLFRFDGTFDSLVSLLAPTSQGGSTACLPWGSRIAFATTSGRVGVTDGTPEGTVVIPVSAAVATETFTASGDRLFFVASDEATGGELWTSDGSPVGTDRIVDLQPGTGTGVDPLYSYLQYPRSALAPLPGSRVVFPADDGAGGQEPWVSDGTLLGTFRLADVALGTGSSRPGWLTACGGRVFFTADDGVSGRELWESDGTREGTLRLADVRPGPGSGRPEYLTCFGDLLAFSADDGTHGREPWISDGTATGTHLAGDLAPGSKPSSPLDFIRAGGFVYLAATDGVHGFELWRWRLSPLELFRDGFESGDLSGWSSIVPP